MVSPQLEIFCSKSYTLAHTHTLTRAGTLAHAHTHASTNVYTYVHAHIHKPVDAHTDHTHQRSNIGEGILHEAETLL